MAWTTPLTAVANATLTAAQWNASVRDNLLETAVAKITAAGQYVVGTAANTLAARTKQAATINTSEATTSTSYTDLTTPGPAVTVTTGTSALVILQARMGNSTSTAQALMGYDISGATTFAALDTVALANAVGAASVWNQCSAVFDHSGLTPGSNVFTSKYKVNTGTGTFVNRRIIVMPY